MPNDITEGKAAQHRTSSEIYSDDCTPEVLRCLATFPERGARCDRERGHDGNHSDNAKAFGWIPEVGSRVELCHCGRTREEHTAILPPNGCAKFFDARIPRNNIKGDDKTLASCREQAVGFFMPLLPSCASCGEMMFGKCPKCGHETRPHDEADERSARICLHAMSLVLADIGKLGDDGLCYCEAVMPVDPHLPHACAVSFLGGQDACLLCHEERDHKLHAKPYQRRHSDKCLRARKALDEFGEWLKTEKAGKAAPVAPEGVNAQESASEELADMLLRELRAEK